MARWLVADGVRQSPRRSRMPPPMPMIGDQTRPLPRSAAPTCAAHRDEDPRPQPDRAHDEHVRARPGRHRARRRRLGRRTPLRLMAVPVGCTPEMDQGPRSATNALTWAFGSAPPGTRTPNPRIKSPLLLRRLHPSGVNRSVHTVVRPDSWRNPVPHSPSDADPSTASEHTWSTPSPMSWLPSCGGSGAAPALGGPVLPVHTRHRRYARRSGTPDHTTGVPPCDRCGR